MSADGRAGAHDPPLVGQAVQGGGHGGATDAGQLRQAPGVGVDVDGHSGQGQHAQGIEGAAGRGAVSGAPASGGCVRAALDDAGLRPQDVDGLVTFTMDTNSEIAVARELQIPELKFFSRINFGGGAAAATVQQAAMAVATGVADVVVAYRAFNERSGHRFGQVSNAAAQQVNTNGIDNAFHYPAGIATPAATVAMAARTIGPMGARVPGCPAGGRGAGIWPLSAKKVWASPL